MSERATIVIPLRRQFDDWLEASVRSALAQSVPTEVIVVTSRLTPRSNLQILTRLQKHNENLVVLLRDQPESFPGAINTGIRHARANRVGLLMSDDWLDETAVAECVGLSADIVSTGLTVYLPNGEINQAAGGPLSNTQFRSLPTLEAKATYLRHFLLFRKELLLQVEGLDENLGNSPGIDDYDLIWTLLEHGATVAVVEKCLYHYRDHDGERLTLQNSEQMLRNFKKILRKHKVRKEEAEKIINLHAPWFGRPMYQVIQARAPVWNSARPASFA
jgi:glycosyltransferase involved in cell wall biosynthesis